MPTDAEQLAAQALKDLQALTDRMNRIEGEHNLHIEALHTQLTEAGVIEYDEHDLQQCGQLPLYIRLAELIRDLERLQLAENVLDAARNYHANHTDWGALRDALAAYDEVASPPAPPLLDPTP